MVSGEKEVVEMSAQANARPIIIKRKKVVGGGGHHGGAWKVAISYFLQSKTLCVRGVPPPMGIGWRRSDLCTRSLANDAPPDFGCMAYMPSRGLMFAECQPRDYRDF